jgi:pre-rRNA-processing protein TSR2
MSSQPISSSSSSANPPPPSPTILLFARGLIALLDLWPALTIAVREEWGGSESLAKKVWMASTLLDEFESHAVIVPSTNTIDSKSAEDPPLDHDEVGDLLNQMMSDEFDANIEDGSIDLIAGDIVKLWKDLVRPGVVAAEDVVGALERKAVEIRGKGVQAQKGGDLVELDGDDESGDESGSGSDEGEGGMDVDEAPQLVAKEKEREEPVVDDDGFTLVQTKGRKGR